MTARTWALILVLAACMAAGAGACGGNSSPSAPSPSPPASSAAVTVTVSPTPLVAVADASGALDRYRVTANLGFQETGGKACKVTVLKEFAGGLRAEFEVALPAVLGIQSAEKPPRYVPVAKVRAVMKTGRIETVEVVPAAVPAAVAVERLYEPQATGRAEMLEGAPEAVADRIVGILAEKSVI